MSLLRLLTTGKSLVGMQDTNSRYRMRTRNLLPKFGSGRNPFAAPAPKGNGPAPGASSKLETGSLFESAQPEPSTPAKPVEKKETRKPIVLPAKPVESPKVEVEAKPMVAAATPALAPAPAIATARSVSKPKPAAKSPAWTGWMKKLNPLALLSQWGGDRAGRNRPARKPVQTELTLDRVRVVRNDLSDTDVEIVPGRLMGMPSGASPILPHPQPQREEHGAWNRLTNKFLGANHVQTH